MRYGMLVVFCTLFSFSTWRAEAQVSLNQLDEYIASESDGLEAFRVRLQDPNPIKARAAMRLLIAQGDDAQRRLAIQHGFGSTDPVIRLEAVRGILDAKPLLLFRWTPTSDKISNNYKNAVARYAGDLETGNVARVPVKIGDYSEESDCWTLERNGNCLVRFNSGEISIAFWGKWAQFELDPQGRLVGSSNISGQRVDALADLTQ